MARTSRCEHFGGTGMLGYFRGAKDFFPEGTFEELEPVVVGIDPIMETGRDGIREAVSRLHRVKVEIRESVKRQEQLRGWIDNQDGGWYSRLSPKEEEMFRKEIRELSSKVEDLRRELKDLSLIFG